MYGNSNRGNGMGYMKTVSTVCKICGKFQSILNKKERLLQKV